MHYSVVLTYLETGARLTSIYTGPRAKARAYYNRHKHKVGQSIKGKNYVSIEFIPC